MANVTKIEGKKGVSYKLTAFCGYGKDGKQMRKFKTWKPDKFMTPRQADKEAIRQARLFEDNINFGSVAYDSTIKFDAYATKWLDVAQIAPKTRETYGFLLIRINQAIGHLRLENIQPHHLQSFYKNLKESGIKNHGRYAVSIELDKLMSERKITRDKLSKLAEVSPATIGTARSGKRISILSAEKIAVGLSLSTKQIFTLHEDSGGLSDKTILHHHRLISAILASAKRERIVPYNVATEFTKAPRVKKKEARYLDDIEAKRLVELLLQEEDIRLITSILLALYSGLRRGELCGLSWGDVDEKNRIIHVRRASQYQEHIGVVEVPTKNESSMRAIRLPAFMFEVLAQYKSWWIQQRILNGSKWQGSDNRLFIQADGKPLFPDTINYWLDKFIKKYDLERFTPHSLRHTFSTLQIMAGVNIRTIQARTGHAQASTLTNIYAHAIKAADELATEALDGILTPSNVGMLNATKIGS